MDLCIVSSALIVRIHQETALKTGLLQEGSVHMGEESCTEEEDGVAISPSLKEDLLVGEEGSLFVNSKLWECG